jgi:PAS domain-containing protein
MNPKNVSISEPIICPETTEAQKSLLKARTHQAQYTDDSFQDVASFAITDPSLIWLPNASGFAFQVLEALPISVFVKDRESRYTYLNAKARQMMAFDANLVIGRKDEQVLKDRTNLQTFMKEDALVIKSRQKRSIAEPWLTETGEYVVHETTRFPILDESDPNIIHGVVSVAEDLSFKQKAQVGQEIVHMIAHDWITEILKSLSDHINGSADDELRARHELIDFVIEYIQNLSFYYSGSTEPRKFRRGVAKCDIISDILTPMEFFFKSFGLNDKYFPSPEMESSLSQREAYCNKSLVKLLVYQQVRNHGGRPVVNPSETTIPLRIRVANTSRGFSLTFLSSGQPIPELTRRQFGQIFERPARKGEDEEQHLCLGLYFCDKIARLHGGTPPEYGYDSASHSNWFKYTIEDLAVAETGQRHG